MIISLDSFPSLPKFGDTGDATVTPGTGPSWSAWTELIAATARHSTHAILSVQTALPQSGSGSISQDVELGIGAAGSEVNGLGSHQFICAPDIYFQQCPGINIAFMVEVPQGRRISFRSRMNVSAPDTSTRVVLTLLG